MLSVVDKTGNYSGCHTIVAGSVAGPAAGSDYYMVVDTIALVRVLLVWW